VVQDLERGGVAVGGVAMFELGVELLVNCVTKVGSDSLEETLANVPACLHTFPLFFLAFSYVGREWCPQRWGHSCPVRSL
jgi:hypothetical protein